MYTHRAYTYTQIFKLYKKDVFIHNYLINKYNKYCAGKMVVDVQ